jgi:predicted SAM-dependent methyltransferase
MLSILRGLFGQPDVQEAAVRRALAEHSCLHLGCGPNLRAGWANVDMEERAGVIAWDLRQPLPCEPGSIAFIFAEHFIEHVDFNEARRALREWAGLLKPGGVLRLSTPNLAFLIAEYQVGRKEEWSDMGWRPSTPCRMVNEGMREWGHQFLYDAPELELALRESGFSHVVPCRWRESQHAALQGAESRPWHHELIYEATP